MTDLGTLTEVDPRGAWPSEAKDCTPGLRDDANHLAKALGIVLDWMIDPHQRLWRVLDPRLSNLADGR